MTKAVSAQGEMLFVEATSGVWTKLEELKSVPEIGESSARLDATTLESEIKEYIKDIPDQNDLEFTFNAMPVSATNSNVKILNDLSRNKTYRWKWVAPRLGKQVIWSGDFTYRYGAGAVSTVRDIILTIIPRTAPIDSDISATYSVTYNANGGTGTMTDSAEYTNGQTVTILANTFTNTGKQFVGWNTRADNSGTAYDANDTFPIYQDTTLYAIWGE